MARLGAHIRFFVRRKIAEDPAWQKPTIIFSGEGTHTPLCRLSMHCLPALAWHLGCAAVAPCLLRQRRLPPPTLPIACMPHLPSFVSFFLCRA
jgi:hypothetical protein